MKLTRTNVTKIASYALIVAGLALLAFPFVREYVQDREQQQILQELEQSLSSGDPVRSYNIQAEYSRLSNVLDAGLERAGTETESDPEESQEPMDERTIGIIQIDKIDLKLPILEGATAQNMKVGAGHMTETAPLGRLAMQPSQPTALEQKDGCSIGLMKWKLATASTFGRETAVLSTR